MKTQLRITLATAALFAATTHFATAQIQAPVQAIAPVAPPTLPAENLSPLSSRLAEINQLARQSLPIIVRHCGSDASCRKQQTAAMQELASKEAAVAKDLRNPALVFVCAR